MDEDANSDSSSPQQLELEEDFHEESPSNSDQGASSSTGSLPQIPTVPPGDPSDQSDGVDLPGTSATTDSIGERTNGSIASGFVRFLAEIMPSINKNANYNQPQRSLETDFPRNAFASFSKQEAGASSAPDRRASSSTGPLAQVPIFPPENDIVGEIINQSIAQTYATSPPPQLDLETESAESVQVTDIVGEIINQSIAQTFSPPPQLDKETDVSFDADWKQSPLPGPSSSSTGPLRQILIVPPGGDPSNQPEGVPAIDILGEIINGSISQTYATPNPPQLNLESEYSVDASNTSVRQRSPLPGLSSSTTSHIPRSRTRKMSPENWLNAMGNAKRRATTSTGSHETATPIYLPPALSPIPTELAAAQNFQPIEEEEEEEVVEEQGRWRPPESYLQAYQLHFLREYFSHNRWPDRDERQILAGRISMDEMSVRRWFRREKRRVQDDDERETDFVFEPQEDGQGSSSQQ